MRGVCRNSHLICSVILLIGEMADSREDRFVHKLNFRSESLALDWKTFKAQFEVVKIARKYADMGAVEQIANLLLLMGSDSVPIFNQFTFHDTNEGQTKTLENVIAMFDRHFEPVKNVIFERVKFNSMKQATLSIHQFITQLQSQADNCDYGVMRNEMIRDRIVVGVNDDKLREYLIDVEDLDLNKCITKAKQYVSHHAQASKLTSNDLGTENLDAIRQPQASSYTPHNEARPNRPDFQRRRWPAENAMSKSKCDFCNKTFHQRDRCPARYSTCHACKGRGHWAKSNRCKFADSTRANEIECDQLEGLYLGDSA